MIAGIIIAFIVGISVGMCVGGWLSGAKRADRVLEKHAEELRGEK